MQLTAPRHGRLLAAIAGCTLALAASPASASTLISTRVAGHERGLAIPRSFLGFSSDWNAVWHLVGNAGTGENPIYQQLVANLSRYGNGVPVLRVGGNYQDSAWWNPTDARPDYEHGVFVNIKPDLMAALAANYRQLHQRLILGINLGVDRASIVRDEARAIVQNIPRGAIDALAIGNEPDFYPNRPAYEKRDANGKLISTLYTRKRKGWNGTTYLRQWEQMAAVIHKVSSRLPLAGTDGYGALVTGARFMAREHRRVALYTEHAYPLAACSPRGHVYQPGEKKYPTLQKLLGPLGAYTTVAQEKRGVAAAHRYHKKYVVSEMNSVSCTSRPELSGSMGAALWALDEFFLQAALGVDQLHMHVDSPVKAPFVFSPFGNGKWAAAVQPPYYAMLAFDAAAGRNGRLLFSPTYLARTKANARVWAVRDGKRLNIVVVNKDLARGGTVNITVPGSTRAGALARLSAPSATSTSGITFAGQAAASPTYDGTLQGTPQTTTIRPHHGLYSFAMPKASAALLSIG